MSDTFRKVLLNTKKKIEEKMEEEHDVEMLVEYQEMLDLLKEMWKALDNPRR